MTLSTAPVDPTVGSAGPGRNWAVVEIRPDGSLGRAEVVTATEPRQAAALLRPMPTRVRPVMGSADLHARLGRLQAAAGHPAEAARSFRRGARAPLGTPGRQSCLGHLSLLEAYQGDLRRAEVHADLVIAANSTNDDPAVPLARVALAWVRLDRAEDDPRGLVADEQPLADTQLGPWLTTLLLLVEARTLVQARRPDVAVRLLAEATDTAEVCTGWSGAVLRAARADAMLAAGEPRRALGLLTPLPAQAVAEAGVVTAAACLAIGDLRGADAVLHLVGEALDRAPLAVQLRAWLLEARIAEDRGDPDRGSRMVDRALHVAAWGGLRTPVLREWHWVRPLVARQAELRRTHRELLAGFRDADPGSTLPAAAGHLDELPAGTRPAASLTQRELEVLDLISEMLSTEEIAATLFVSANTVKTHIKGIFVKLGVNRRVDAVRRGRQLRLC